MPKFKKQFCCDMLSTRQAAKYLGLPEGTIKSLRYSDQGGPVFYKLAGRVVYKSEDLDSYIESCRVKGGSK
jgi:hypothetical protein